MRIRLLRRTGGFKRKGFSKRRKFIKKRPYKKRSVRNKRRGFAKGIAAFRQKLAACTEQRESVTNYYGLTQNTHAYYTFNGASPNPQNMYGLILWDPNVAHSYINNGAHPPGFNSLPVGAEYIGSRFMWNFQRSNYAIYNLSKTKELYLTMTWLMPKNRDYVNSLFALLQDNQAYFKPLPTEVFKVLKQKKFKIEPCEIANNSSSGVRFFKSSYKVQKMITKLNPAIIDSRLIQELQPICILQNWIPNDSITAVASDPLYTITFTSPNLYGLGPTTLIKIGGEQRTYYADL